PSLLCRPWSSVSVRSILDHVSNGIRDPGRFEAFRIDANDGDISLRRFAAAFIIQDFEIITHGLLAFELRRQPHPNRMAVANPLGKLCKDFNARHPHVIRLKHRLPLLSTAAKELFLRLLEESKIV